jgi:spore coat polysaccharide biosynthesis predicted glycosyltransferase SpsG
MKAVFYLFGGSGIGFGHCSRMINYARRHFRDNINEVIFLVNNDENLLDYLKGSGIKYTYSNFSINSSNLNLLQLIVNNNPALMNAKAWYIDVKHDVSQEILFLKTLSCHVTLFDSTNPARFLADINIYPTPLFHRTDFNWTGYQGEVRGGWDELLISDSFYKLKKLQEGNLKDRVLISFGASDPNRITLLAMKLMSAFPNLRRKVDVVIGLDFQFKDEIFTLDKQFNNFFNLIELCDDLAPYFKSVEYVFTAVGNTIYESLLMDAKVFVISNYHSDKQDLIKLSKLDGVIVLGHYNEVLGQDLSGFLSQYFNVSNNSSLFGRGDIE